MSDEIVKKEQHALTTVSQYVDAANNYIASAATLISDALRTCSEEEVALIHEWALRGKESFEEFDKVTKGRLLEYMKTNARQVTEKGTLEIDIGNGRVQRATPTSTKPDDKLTEKVLRDNKLPPETCMLPTTSWKIDMSRFGNLKTVLTEEEHARCFKPVSYRVGKTKVKGEDDDE